MSDTPSYDTAWHARLLPLLHAEPAAYVSLEPSAESQLIARQFFDASGHTASPSLLPDMTAIVGREQVIDDLSALLDDIQTQEQNPVVRHAYQARIKQLIAEQSMVIAAVQGDNLIFETQNNYVYGAPDPAIFASICAWIRSDIEAADTTQHPEILELLDLLPAGSGSVADCLPSQQTFDAVKALHAKYGGYYMSLFGPEGLPTSPTIDQDEGGRIVTKLLANLGADYRLDPTPGALWSVRHSNKVITCPATYTLPNRTFVSLMCHELGSHLLEAINGAKQPLALMQTGLDRYEAGNEGRACLREQILFDTPLDYTRVASWDPAGIALPSFAYDATLHLIISLATGTMGYRWEFAELYRVAYLLQMLWQVKSGDTVIESACHDFAWHISVRTLKGTDGTGGAYRKDIVYLEGNIRCWRAAARNPQAILWGDYGKFDITNEMHIRMLTDLGILPSA